jgi:hypothetical protein
VILIEHHYPHLATALKGNGVPKLIDMIYIVT